MSKEKRGKLIGIVSFKGGVGKSTVNENCATVINRCYKDIDVAIIDVDDSQESLIEERSNELESLKDGNIQLKKEFKILENRDTSLFPIYKAKPTDIEKIAEISKKHDLVFIDFPGSYDVQGVDELVYFLNFIIVPFFVDSKTFNSSVKTLKHIDKLSNTKGNHIEKYGVFINRYSKHKLTNEAKGLNNFFKTYELNVLEPFYYDINFEKGNTSTIIPVLNKKVEGFVDSLLKFINFI